MDPEDPTVIAENELLGAAAAIEAAAKKLEQLKPRAWLLQGLGKKEGREQKHQISASARAQTQGRP